MVRVSSKFTALFAIALLVTSVASLAGQGKPAPIVIISPSGGEVFIPGQTQRVVMQVQSTVQTIEVRLSTDNGATFPVVLATVNNVGTERKATQIATFPVPVSPSTQCIIQANGTTKKGPVTAISGSFVIGSPFLPPGSVTETIVAPAGIATLNLQDGSVTTPKLANLAVTNPKIAELAVTNNKISSEVGGAGGSNATNNFVLAADGAGKAIWKDLSTLGVNIDTANIIDGAVTSVKIEDGTITTADLSPIAGITDGQVNDNLTITGSPGINNSPIGATTPSSGVFTTLRANTSFQLAGGNITLPNGETINGQVANVLAISDGTSTLTMDTTGAGGAGLVLRGQPATGLFRIEGINGSAGGSGTGVELRGGQGSAPNGSGGAVTIKAGLGVGNGNGGDITLDPGTAAAGTVGILKSTSPTFTLDSDNPGPAVNVDVVANTGNAATSGVLRYTPAGIWQISSTGQSGTFNNILTSASGNFWGRTGNAGTTAPTTSDPLNNNWIGTSDAQNFVIGVDNKHAIRFVPSSNPSIVGGHFANTLFSAGVIGTVIAGGGGGASFHTAFDRFGFIGGGESNIVGLNDGDAATQTHATVSGGQSNTASRGHSTIGGGQSNTASGAHSTVGGGQSNTASGQHATIAGGISNQAGGAAGFAAGDSNNASGANATAIGDTNVASGVNATGIGLNNTAAGINSVALGTGNTVLAATTGGIVVGNSSDVNANAGIAMGTDAVVAATHTNSFIWSDINGFSTTAANQFLVNAAGGIWLRGIVSAGDDPTVLTDADGKILSSALNTIQVPQGGTGQTSHVLNAVLYGNGTNPILNSGASTAAGQFLQTTASGGAPTWKTVLDVVNGGTGLNSGTSGGIPFFNSATTMASSGVLAANALVLGGGAGTAPATLGSLGTTSTVLHGNAAGAPSFGAVVLTSDVSGILPVANGGSGVNSAAANTFFAAPNGAAGAPSFRLLVGADLPSNAAAPYVLDTGDTMTGALTNTTNTTSLLLTGTPNNASNASLIQIAGAITGGDGAANGGTYLGMNTPAAGAGSAADLVNLQQNNVSRFRLTGAGVATFSGAVNAASFTGTVATTNLSGFVAINNGGTGTNTTSQNFIFAGPTAGAGAPSFRAMVAGDLPGGAGAPYVLDTGDTMTGALFINAQPTASATASLLGLGNAIVGGDATANGGTFLGLNAPAAGAGSVADFINFQQNGVVKFRVFGNSTVQGATFKALDGASPSLNVTAGTPLGNSSGGSVTVAATNATGGSSDGGALTFNAGAATSQGNGGDVSITSGNAVSGVGIGGDLSLTAGDAQGATGAAGALSLAAGSATGSGAGGNITLAPGNSGTGTVGRVVITRNVELSGTTPTITSTGNNNIVLTPAGTGVISMTRPLNMGANDITTTGVINGNINGNITGNLTNTTVTVTGTTGTATMTGATGASVIATTGNAAVTASAAAANVNLTPGAGGAIVAGGALNLGGFNITNIGSATATTFNGNLSGNVTGTLTGNVTNTTVTVTGSTGSATLSGATTAAVTGATGATVTATAGNAGVVASDNAGNVNLTAANGGTGSGAINLTAGTGGITVNRPITHAAIAALTGGTGATVTATTGNASVVAAANNGAVSLSAGNAGANTGGISLIAGTDGITVNRPISHAAVAALTGGTGATITATSGNATVSAAGAAADKVVLTSGATGGVEVTAGVINTPTGTALSLTGTGATATLTSANGTTVSSSAANVTLTGQTGITATATTGNIGLTATAGTVNIARGNLTSATAATPAAVINNTVAGGVGLRVTNGAVQFKTANWDGTAGAFPRDASVVLVSGFAANTISFPALTAADAGQTVLVINTDGANNVTTFTGATLSAGYVLIRPGAALTTFGQHNGITFVWDGAAWRGM